MKASNPIRDRILGPPSDLVDLAARALWTAVQTAGGTLAFDTLSDTVDLSVWDVAGASVLSALVMVATGYARKRIDELERGTGTPEAPDG